MQPIKKYIALVLGCVATLSACDNNLEEEVYSDVTEQTYVFTDANKAIGIVYANMRSMFGHTTWWMAQETTSDAIVMPANASGWDDGGIYKRMHLHTWNSENVQINNMWNTLYRGVINATRIIEQTEDGRIPIPAGSSKEALLAEVRLARAFFYWQILDNFGDAPLIKTTAKDLPEKAPRKDIYQFVVSEITGSLPLLSEDNGRATYGRFNKWAAKALLANVYLNAQVYTGQAQWAEVISQCDDIINSGKYALEADFRSSFRTQNENSAEVVFAVPFDESLAGGLSVHMFSWHASLRGKVGMQATPWGSGSAMGVTQFIDTYDPADKRLADTWLQGPQFAANGTTPLLGTYDQAGKQLVFTRELPDGLYTGEAQGLRMNKFEVKANALGSLSNDFPVFRYAQVLLMKAESLLRTGKSADAALLVTQVRERAYPDQPLKALVTGGELEQNTRYTYGYVENYQIVDPGNTSPVPFGRFLDELGYEFAWEGHRRRDMIRFGVYTTKSWLSHKPQGTHRSVFPIPQQALNSNPKLKQHQEYR
jgi:starch-binding outer membrane protein, SusD/RagB family